MRVRIAIAIVLACAVVGCSNHPLIDDVTRLSTYDVMNKVRCEAAEAIQARDRELSAKRTQKQKEEEALEKTKEDHEKLDEEINELQRQFAPRGKERDRLTLRKSEISSMISALKLVLDDLDGMLDKKKDRQGKQPDPEVVALLIEKTRKRVFAVTDEALLVSKLTKQLTEELEKAETAIKNKRKEQTKLGFAGELRKINDKYAALGRFEKATLAMVFNFEITENNSATIGDTSVTWPIHLGTFTLGLSASKERTRKGDREVSTAASFKDLRDEKKLDCRFGTEYTSGRAKTYPVTGKIGMAEFIDQYFKISDSVAIKTGEETFRDILTFTTTIKGGIAPSIQLARVSPSKVAGKLELKADRKDIHEVTVAVYPAKSSEGGAGTATPNIGAVTGELSLRAARDSFDRYLPLGKDNDRNSHPDK